jgi:Ca2+/Na+ antiporter
MRIPTVTKSGVVVSVVVLFATLSIGSTQSVHAADLLVEKTMGFAPIAELGVMASGAVEDTLKACMARIPDFASVGQRMLAEQSCAGDEQVRKAIRSAPKF